MARDPPGRPHYYLHRRGLRQALRAIPAAPRLPSSPQPLEHAHRNQTHIPATPVRLRTPWTLAFVLNRAPPSSATSPAKALVKKSDRPNPSPSHARARRDPPHLTEPPFLFGVHRTFAIVFNRTSPMRTRTPASDSSQLRAPLSILRPP